MPNTIALAKNYTDLLDEVYKNASVTADLTSDSTLMRAGANANEILYPQISVDGLGDYSRSGGYTDSSVTLAWKTAQFNYDRGAKITVDTMDDEETFNISFGMAGGELQRTKVAPEADAFTFATIAGKAGISKVATGATLSSGDAFLAALLVGLNKMAEDEVPEENLLLYATPTLLNSIKALDTTKSKEVLATFAAIKPVPQSRFYTAIDLLDGKTTGEEAGHFVKYAKHYYEGASTDSGALKVVANSATPDTGEIKLEAVTPCVGNYTPEVNDYVLSTEGKDINFMIIHKPAVIKFDKHVVSSIISPDNNANADAYIAKYRKYGIVDVYNNKVAGIYLHHKA